MVRGTSANFGLTRELMENQNKDDRNEQSDLNRRPARNVNIWILLILFSSIAIFMVLMFFNNEGDRISSGYFMKLLENKDYYGEALFTTEDDGPKKKVMQTISYVRFEDLEGVGYFNHIPPREPAYNTQGELEPASDSIRKYKRKFRFNLPQEEEARRDLLDAVKAANVNFDHAQPSNIVGFYSGLLLLFTLGFLLFMFLSVRRSQNQMLGGGGFLSNFSRSPAKKYEASEEPITFKDVAGLEGVKADLKEIVEFLKDPSRFQKLGGRVPKGVLLIGPPGTGKTLLAKAVAGEAEVPYFSVNGSEFIQMFVGVGASRVRDLFQTAKAQAPAIIFVDEIDAVGRQRGAGLGGGHDEREQTLNQILGEMDGFQGADSVIVLAATNRPDVLDPALLRPGRFDRHVTVSKPTLKGRHEIFKVHVRNVPLAQDVDLKILAQATTGMTGADIQNLVNEAALWAARNNANKVTMDHFYHAHDKVLMGAVREEVVSAKEKERTAYHEAGHTIAAWFLEGAYPVHKVTIIPRGFAAGVTQMVPDEERMNMSENELKDQLVMMLAGRAAEKLIYDEFTVGAQNDLEKATSVARRMVTQWGMSTTVGPVSFKMTEEDPFLGREMHQSRVFSEHTMEVIDDEITKILHDAAKRALEMMGERRDDLEALTRKIIEHEELDRFEIEEVLGKSVHKPKAQDFGEAKKEDDQELDSKEVAADSDGPDADQDKP
jgi:cell division protease FtsH